MTIHKLPHFLFLVVPPTFQSHQAFAEYRDLLEALEEKLSSGETT